MPEVNAHHLYDTCHMLFNKVYKDKMDGIAGCMPKVNAHHSYETCHMGVYVILNHAIWVYMLSR